MNSLLDALREIGLAPSLIVVILFLIVVVRELWHFQKSKRLAAHAATLEQQIAVAADVTRSAFDEHFAEIQRRHSKKYDLACELRGHIEDFSHFALRVAEGRGWSERHDDNRTYCDLLKERYWQIRDYVRAHRQRLGAAVADSVLGLTEVAQPLVDDCNGPRPTLIASQSGDCARAVIEATRDARRSLDAAVNELDRPPLPPPM